jgi:hypothetical protein
MSSAQPPLSGNPAIAKLALEQWRHAQPLNASDIAAHALRMVQHIAA